MKRSAGASSPPGTGEEMGAESVRIGSQQTTSQDSQNSDATHCSGLSIPSTQSEDYAAAIAPPAERDRKYGRCRKCRCDFSYLCKCTIDSSCYQAAQDVHNDTSCSHAT